MTQLESLRVLAAEVRALRAELAAEQNRADYVLGELANEHALPRYSTEEVLSLLIVIDGIGNYPREFIVRIPRLFEAADAVRASREPPR